MRMPFGDHRGKELYDIDLGYLKWLEEQAWVRPELREALQFEIQRREGDISSLGRVVKP
jgi:uncharacterized protein (DUF3820 family)